MVSPFKPGTRIMKIAYGEEDTGPFCYRLPIGARATVVPLDSEYAYITDIDAAAIPDGGEEGGIQSRCWVEIPDDTELAEQQRDQAVTA